MSYDLEVWSVRAPDVRSALKGAGSWSEHGVAFIHQGAGGGWQVVVGAADAVEPEDVPDEVAQKLLGIKYLTRINVEPSGAPSSACELAFRVATRIAGTSGVVVDVQTGELSTRVATAKHPARSAKPKRSGRFTLLQMTWWFGESPLLERAGLDALLNRLSGMLPEALPVRYGLYEPPQHRLSETGLDHFRDFLAKHTVERDPRAMREIIVWYPKYPVVGVSISPCDRWGATSSRGFECSYLAFEFDFQAVRDSEWSARLVLLWKAVSKQIRPFYGDVRTRNGAIHSGATYAFRMGTEESPVCGGQWRGVPRDPGHACVCSPAYLELWPSFKRAANLDGGLGFVSTADWRTRESIRSLVGEVPDDIAQRWTPYWAERKAGGKTVAWNTDYPPKWPFGPPPPSDPKASFEFVRPPRPRRRRGRWARDAWS